MFKIFRVNEALLFKLRLATVERVGMWFDQDREDHNKT